VLAYGIPPFRLPREIIRQEEMDHLRAMGVEFRTDFHRGQNGTLEELFDAGFDAVFLGTGAGLPHLMGIPGENLIGVYTANEFLTRINLMKAYEFPASDTPVRVGRPHGGGRWRQLGHGRRPLGQAAWAASLSSCSGGAGPSCAPGRRNRARRRGRREVRIPRGARPDSGR
jgi:hypothetical protein